MSGEPTSDAALESPQGQDDQTGQQPGAATTTAPARQDRPNWYDDPKFREMQSKKDREVAEARQQAAVAYQQSQQLQQQMRELQMRDLSQEEQTQFKLREAEQNAAGWQQAYYAEMQRQQIDNEKRSAIKELLGDGDYPEVKADDLMETKSATEAAKLAARLQRERSSGTQQRQEERRQANRTDMGTGSKPSIGNDDFDTLLNKAQTAEDLARLLTLARKKERA